MAALALLPVAGLLWAGEPSWDLAEEERPATDDRTVVVASLKELATLGLPKQGYRAVSGAVRDALAEQPEGTKVRLVIGERRSRWGSCSRRGTLSFCYRLVMAPPETIDAVVAHELCHLVHLNHSRRFYALLDRVCPGHREAMDWLADHHDELQL